MTSVFLTSRDVHILGFSILISMHRQIRGCTGRFRSVCFSLYKKCNIRHNLAF